MRKIFTFLFIAITIAFLGCTDEENKVDGRLLGLDIKFKHTSPRTGEVLTNVYEDAYRDGDMVQISIESSYEIERIEVVNGTTKTALTTIDVNGTTASFSYPAADLEIPFGQRAALKFHFYFNDAGKDGFDYPSMKSITFNANSDIPSIVNFKKSDGSVVELKTTDYNIVGFAEDEVHGVYATTIPDEISYLEVENSSLLNFGASRNFSISFWIQSDHDESDPAIMGTQDWNSSNNKGWVIAWLNGRIRAVACDGDGNKTDLRTAEEQSILGADWHFVTVVFNRTANAEIWIDGQLAVSTVMVNGNIDTGLPVKINQDGTGTYSPRLGAKYSDIFFYDYALTEAQIQAIFNAK
ncbi:Concanavalin A-like lectin [Lentimicrobium saccharophilum]|uniref:Concanavalin A-like lectin n=1 Tax=Lentimicrobium saccharophilum TaxID=1678841 RepID=A0A0S7BXV8_9BACT|nr:LamG-like jellyroll fold domain-containing protein [Lentimicrobium saccharophilum]GAP42449.1 Concanavalin A-like lectin [Lentimicrobium saccharophilum]